jgi:hypothetical protein
MWWGPHICDWSGLHLTSLISCMTYERNCYLLILSVDQARLTRHVAGKFAKKQYVIVARSRESNSANVNYEPRNSQERQPAILRLLSFALNCELIKICLKYLLYT